MILLVLATTVGLLSMYRGVNGLTRPSQLCFNKGRHQKQNERMHLPVQMYLPPGLHTSCAMPCPCLADASQASMTPQTQMLKSTVSYHILLFLTG